MKFLLLLAIVLLAVWLLRSGRRRDDDPAGRDVPAPPGPQEMVRCAHCGVHLPHSEAVVGRIGLYCSPEHRQLAEP
jgi:uncharacterized protein